MSIHQKDWHYCHVDSRGAVTDPAGVASKLVSEYGVAIEYDTFETAQAAIKTAAGLI